MAKQRVLARLLRLRHLEEEQSRLELELAVAWREGVSREIEAQEGRAAASRRTFVERLADPDTSTRTGASMELDQARRARESIRPRLVAAEEEVARRRGEFLERRTARRQVEILEDAERQKEREEAARRAQQMLDDWYGRRVGRGAQAAGAEAAESAARPLNLSPIETER